VRQHSPRARRCLACCASLRGRHRVAPRCCSGFLNSVKPLAQRGSVSQRDRSTSSCAETASRSARTRETETPRGCRPSCRTDPQAAKLIQPGKRALYNPAKSAQATPVRGAAHRQQRHDMPQSETAPNGGCVVAAIPEYTVRTKPRSTAFALDWGNRPPTPGLPASRCGSRRSGERRAAHAAHLRPMTLAPVLGPIGRIRPPGLITAVYGEDGTLSTTARDQLIRLSRASRAGAQSGPSPRRRPVASRVPGASTSSSTHTRVPAGAFARDAAAEDNRNAGEACAI
jgi:hypothetical protein